MRLNGLCHGGPVYFVFFFPSSVLKGTTCKRQRRKLSKTLYLTLETQINFEKPLGRTVFKNSNCNLLWLSLVLSFVFAMLLTPFVNVLSSYFYPSSICWSQRLTLATLLDTALLTTNIKTHGKSDCTISTCLYEL